MSISIPLSCLCIRSGLRFDHKGDDSNNRFSNLTHDVFSERIIMIMAQQTHDPHCAGRHFRTKLMSRYIGAGQNDRFDLALLLFASFVGIGTGLHKNELLYLPVLVPQVQQASFRVNICSLVTNFYRTPI